MLTDVNAAKASGANAASSATTKYLTTKQVARRLGVCDQTLRNWRGMPGLGPRYTRFGARIRYSLDAILAFENTRTFDSRADEKSVA